MVRRSSVPRSVVLRGIGRATFALPCCRCWSGRSRCCSWARPCRKPGSGRQRVRWRPKQSRDRPQAVQYVVAVDRVALRTQRAGHRDHLRTERSEEHTSELQSLTNLVCRLLLEKKKKPNQ